MKKAKITCPYCDHQQEVEIPSDCCLAFHKCENCERLISASEKNECCVVCAYSDKVCPAKHDDLNHKAENTKKGKRRKRIFKFTLLFFTLWFLIVMSGLAYFIFLDSNLSKYFEDQKNKDASTNVSEEYKALLNEIKTLNGKNVDEEAKIKIEELTKEVENLRVLNPYYQIKAIKADLIPEGTPGFYGETLFVSFDKVQESINVLAALDPTYGEDKIELSGELLKRYTGIGLSISCEYCCGVEAIVNKHGEAACGCAHSQAMRGLAAYLLDSHHEEYTDDRILEELKKWKTVFFPKQTIQKVLAEKKKAGEEGIDELLNEFPDFLPDMVGGC